MDSVTDPIIAANRPHKYLGILGMIWISFLIVALLVAVKTFSIGPFIFPVGTIAYPFTYIFADIFTEVYGYRVTRRIVWTGFICLGIVSILSYFYSIVPPSASFTEDKAFRTVFMMSPIVSLATICSFFSGELSNSVVLAKLKIYTDGSMMWTRLIGSTLVGQFADNTVWFFIVMLFAKFYNWNDFLPLVLSSVLFCTFWEIIALPITYRVIKFLKKQEGLDPYDKGTNFNPFRS